VSDGLAIDVDRLAAASGVGVALAAVPTAEGATGEQALGGGEDYELVFSAADPEVVTSAFAQAGLRPPLRIGTCTGDRTERRLDGRRLEPRGWEHDW
jgi:thiamine-monophosphate kinase